MNRKGSMVVGLLFLLGFSLIIGVPVLHAATTINQTSVNNQLSAQAFYLAEAGIQEARQIVRYKAENGKLLLSQTADQVIAVVGEQLTTGRYEATAVLKPDNKVVIISKGYAGSTAAAGGGYTATADTSLELSLVPGGGGGSGGSGGGGGSAPPLDMALFAADGFRMQGSPSIVGNAVTNATGSDKVDLDWSCSLQGDLTIGPGASVNTVVDLPNHRLISDAMTGTVKNLASARTYPDPEMPSFPSLGSRPSVDAGWWPAPPHFINQDGYYPEIDVKSELRIDVGSGERVIRTDSLKISGSGQLVIVGSGKLTLFVDKTFDIAGSGTFNASGSPEKVNIYYNGTKDFSLSGAGAFNGSIQAATADVKITGSGRMAGHIVTGGDEVDLSGDGAAGVTLVYAPKARVDISGSARVTGSVICKYADLTGTGSIRYDNGVSSIYSQLVGGGGSGTIDFGDSIWAPTK